jgi:hypothetical protein
LQGPPFKTNNKVKLPLYKQVYRFSTDAACSPFGSLSGHKPDYFKSTSKDINKEQTETYISVEIQVNHKQKLFNFKVIVLDESNGEVGGSSRYVQEDPPPNSEHKT